MGVLFHIKLLSGRFGTGLYKVITRFLLNLRFSNADSILLVKEQIKNVEVVDWLLELAKARPIHRDKCC